MTVLQLVASLGYGLCTGVLFGLVMLRPRVFAARVDEVVKAWRSRPIEREDEDR